MSLFSIPSPVGSNSSTPPAPPGDCGATLVRRRLRERILSSTPGSALASGMSCVTVSKAFLSLALGFLICIRRGQAPCSPRPLPVLMLWILGLPTDGRAWGQNSSATGMVTSVITLQMLGPPKDAAPQGSIPSRLEVSIRLPARRGNSRLARFGK